MLLNNNIIGSCYMEGYIALCGHPVTTVTGHLAAMVIVRYNMSLFMSLADTQQTYVLLFY